MVNLLHWPLGFSYFTQLSNLFLAAVILLQLLLPRARALPTLKFSAVVSIFVTFFVFLTVLGPAVPGGLPAAYAQDHGASFCLHLLTPLLAFWDFYGNDALYPYGRRHAFLSILPPLGYFLLILALGRLGLRWGPGRSMMAPYPFLDYGSSAGWFGFRPGGGSGLPRIGAFYAVLLLLALFYAASAVQLSLARFKRKRAPDPDAAERSS